MKILHVVYFIIIICPMKYCITPAQAETRNKKRIKERKKKRTTRSELKALHIQHNTPSYL